MSARYSSPAVLGPIQQQVLKLEQYMAQSSIESHIYHLVKLRASQINGCAYCMSMHTRDLLNAGERIDRIAVLPAWREAPWFSDREQAALAFTEAVTRLEHQDVPDEVFEQAKAVFSEQELADLTLGVATINTWNRLCITWRVIPDEFTIEAKAPASAV